MTGPAVAVVGLGMIGAGASRLLAAAGHRVLAVDVSPEADVDGAGAERASSPADAARRSGCTVVAVYDDAQVREVLLGPDGVVGGAGPGHVAVVLSTVTRETVEVCAAALADAGVALLDCGVSGGHELLSGGRLTLSVGGDPAVLDRVRPLLACVGDPVVRMGGLGSGMAAKLARNLLHYATAAVDLEAARLALAAGVDPDAFVAFVRAADAKAPARMHYLAVGADGRPAAPSLPAVGYAIKDLAAAASLAGEVGERLPLGDAVRTVFAAADGGPPRRVGVVPPPRG